MLINFKIKSQCAINHHFIRFFAEFATIKIQEEAN